MVDAAEEAEQVERVDPAAPGDAVLAVGREDVVLRAQRAAGADLGGLLAEELGPDPELAVALEGGGLDVDAPGQHHVAVEAADHLVLGLVAGVEAEVRVLDPLALGRQELDELGAAVELGGSEDLHQIGAEPPVLALAVGAGVLGHARSFEVIGRAGSPRAEGCRPGRGRGGGATCDPEHNRAAANLPADLILDRMSASDVSASTTIAAPPAVVFAILADPRQHARIDGSGTVQGRCPGRSGSCSARSSG